MAMFTAMSLLDASTQVRLNPWEISKAGIVIQNMQKEGRFSSSDINAVCRGLLLQRPDDVAATWQVLGPKDYADPKAGMDARELRQVLPMLGEDVAPREIKALFDRVDTDGSGRMDHKEFVFFNPKSLSLTIIGG